ncbi:MAG TPA: choice-of-anchor X domain-containing protein [Polyangia bacterium]|jgi:hypothetical protein|nr:choice-of-anchor X domain-containing protein [Polyangia bacterium]
MPAADSHRARVDGKGGAAATATATPVLTLGGPTEERLRRNLDEYKKVAVYPPWSRPFTDGTKYLLSWNKPATSDLPMDDTPGKETTYHFDADRAHVAYGEAITSWIEVWKNGDPLHRLPITVEDAWVMGDVGPKTGRLVKLGYHDDGQDGDEVAGDGRYTNRLVPSQLAALKQATQVHLAATVSHDGVRRMFVREFTYAPRKVVDVVGVSDSVRGGSLVVTLDVDVNERGTYDFEANLMSGDGAQPIGYTQMNFTLSPGRQNVDLLFFGRMFSERGVDGPFLVRDIRGLLLSLDGGESNIPFQYDTPYLTKPWRSAELSSSPWDAPEKGEKIATMEKLIADTAAGRIGGPTSQPQHIDIDEHGVAHVVNDEPPPK